MKKVITALFVLLLCGGIMLGGLASGNIIGTFPVAIGIVFLSVYRRDRNGRQLNQKRLENQFRQFMHYQAQNRTFKV